jgi:hypothetical protein
MKTPRDILFQRHQAAAPKLDAIRREVVDELNNQETKEQRWTDILVASLLGYSNKLSQELFWPCRRIWVGLAVAWILLFIVNVSLRDPASSVTGKSVRPGQVMMSLQAQQRWVNELLADRSVPLDTERPRNFTPKPRTERIETATI